MVSGIQGKAPTPTASPEATNTLRSVFYSSLLLIIPDMLFIPKSMDALLVVPGTVYYLKISSLMLSKTIPSTTMPHICFLGPSNGLKVCIPLSSTVHLAFIVFMPCFLSSACRTPTASLLTSFCILCPRAEAGETLTIQSSEGQKEQT